MGETHPQILLTKHFYVAGHYDLAQPFYKIAAAQNTGAASDMTSALRLKLLAGDIDGALIGSYECARRYNDSYRYRDYLGMLHASGQSQSAWAAFTALIRELPKPHLWETALVGHHISGISEAEVVAWVQQENVKNTAERTNTAARYLVRFTTTDRIPPQDIPAQIDKIDHRVMQFKVPNPPVVPPSKDASKSVVPGPAVGERQAASPGVPETPKKHRPRTHLAHFAEAYRALKLGEFEVARKDFDDAAKVSDMNEQSLYQLPYYALAAAKAGDVAGVEGILQRVKPEQQRFWYNLSKAVLAAVAGKTDDAMQLLVLARYRRPNTEKWPLLTQYVFGEITELLALTTGNPKIRDLAIDWARQNQRSEPWQSWSYAIEATLTTNALDRQRAIAMLHYLDPLSLRLSAFKKPQIDEAVRIHGKSNPFLKKSVEHKANAA